MNTVAPAGMPLPPRKSLDSLRRVFQTGQPVLSDLFTGALTDTPVVALEVPVKRRDGTVVYDLVLNPTPHAFLAPIHDPASTAAVTTVYGSSAERRVRTECDGRLRSGGSPVYSKKEKRQITQRR